ncbi:Nucleoside triphosphate pyrophosphohydrolase [Corynebacterium occultum]|uniref:Nucleoside triphosphate pyrophosphohydrolase n=1 Tax=Corynebacterium occultum TaxID=2675219 RepID=A0A6B8W7J9_9CORY|nr:MazG nucleotide pyrophosphohydrolase domain-containing protein [Corynebacterium occultum]QGU06856.1 Nucleoside triphosphate pyrophosphohydrolase [Corynebacterium occultum]
MTVLLLDARWPTMIPVDALAALSGLLSYTEEVPIPVRWHLGDLVREGEGQDVLVSTNPRSAEVQARLERGELCFRAPSLADPVGEAVSVMEQACSRGEWESSQTHRSLIPYLREESDEFVEAIGQWEAGQVGEEELLRELGDVLLQVLFHAEIAARRGAFNFSDVAASFVTKMRSRSPYFFDGSVGPVSREEQDEAWAAGKRREMELPQAGISEKPDPQ